MSFERSAQKVICVDGYNVFRCRRWPNRPEPNAKTVFLIGDFGGGHGSRGATVFSIFKNEKERAISLDGQSDSAISGDGPNARIARGKALFGSQVRFYRWP